MRRTIVVLLVFFAAAGFLATAVLGAGAPPARPAQDGFSLVMPLLGRNARFDDLPTIAVPTATPPPTVSPIPSATVEVPATYTPVPSRTPTAAVTGAIRGRLTDGGEPMAYGMGDGFGPGLFLQRCRDGEEPCEVIGRTGVVKDGRYEFRVPDALGEDEYYQVIWFNENGMFGEFKVDGADLWLGVWYGPPIHEYEPGDEIDLADIELANFALTGPSHGTGYQGWPWLFTWDRWAGSGGKYKWSIGDNCSELEERDRAWQAPSTAKTEQLVERLPPGLQYNIHYCWFVEVDGGEEIGYGQTYHVWMLWFIPQLFESFEVVNPNDALRPLPR
jgi:hypothetical protein